MGSEVPHVESFARTLGEGPQRERQFLLLDPGGDHRYLFRRNREPMRLVASLVSGEGLKRSLGSYVLRGCAYAPPLARAVPLVSPTTLSLPAQWSFDVGIVSNRTRLVCLDEATVYTLPTDDESGIIDEVTVRRKLPPEINTPTLYESDLEYPYFAEAFIDGRRPESPITEWPVLENALGQLAALYRDRERTVETEAVVSEIRARLDSRGLLDEPPFPAALEALDTLGLPECVYEAPIHGDLHARNVLSSDGAVYILDWENYGNGYVFEDFFKPFVVSYYDTRDPAFFRELVAGEGRGGDIFKAYLDRLGEHVCPDPQHYAGLPVVYLLLDLATEERKGLWETNRELLGSVVRNGR